VSITGISKRQVCLAVLGDRSAGQPMNVEIYLKEIGDVHDHTQVMPTNTLGIAMTRSSALIKLAVQRS
jgi:hypothetical protein